MNVAMKPVISTKFYTTTIIETTSLQQHRNMQLRSDEVKMSAAKTCDQAEVCVRMGDEITR